MINILVSKAGQTLQVDWDSMPANAQAHIIEYGLRQKLNDAGSSATKKELGPDASPQAFALAETVLSALMEGRVTVRQAAASLTLEEKEYNKALKEYLKKTFGGKAEGKTLDDLAKVLGKPTNVLDSALQSLAARRAVERRKVNDAALAARALTLSLD